MIRVPFNELFHHSRHREEGDAYPVRELFEGEKRVCSVACFLRRKKAIGELAETRVLEPQKDHSFAPVTKREGPYGAENGLKIPFGHQGGLGAGPRAPCGSATLFGGGIFEARVHRHAPNAR